MQAVALSVTELVLHKVVLPLALIVAVGGVPTVITVAADVVAQPPLFVTVTV